MLTGTPLDLTPFGPLLSALGIAYWVVAIGLLGLALWLPKRWWIKLPLALAVAAGFILPVARHVESRSTQRAEWKARLDESMALFAERCKTAGEKITRTVDNVDGVVWMKWREEMSNRDNFADQWKLNDPYGRDCGLEDCISHLLKVTKGAALNPEDAKRHAVGFRFVETSDPGDGQKLRYAGVIKAVHKRTTDELEQFRKNTGRDADPEVFGYALERVVVEKFVARYGATWDDISTREDREHWIAGSSLKVVDLRTNEILAERVGYMVDQGQGSQAGGRSPWALAQQTACPEFPVVGPSDPRRLRRHTSTRDFLTNVLRPSSAE